MTDTDIEQIREMGKYYAAQEIARRVAGGMTTMEATTQLGNETHQLLEQVKQDETEFAERHREFLRGVLLRCD